MANRLAQETSPYLLQHADNPVDWYPWGDEAFETAKAEDKPVFLSVGYSACHWCHVMEHESFEDEATAALMNEHFVSVKVDREERPDVDAIYMKAVQAMTERGGWPMSVFLTPEREPFYGGTYFPDTPRHGMPSFTQVLERISKLWRSQREEVASAGTRLSAALAGSEGVTAHPSDNALDRDVLGDAASGLSRSFDHVNGGWGGAPKFPQPAVMEFLLRRHLATGDSSLLAMVTRTLDAMARGGIYDQLGGGFHRYATDAIWLVPHFEKMLYDNAQLARLYLHAWLVTGSERYRRITEETLDYVVREMLDASGGFYSAQDADSEGEEGRFFVWTKGQVLQALEGRSERPLDDAELFCAVYGVTESGNFEGSNTLSLVGPTAQAASEFGSGVVDVESRLAAARAALLEAREGRPRPGTDDKVLLSWNGLMLSAFAEAARALDRQDYLLIAEANADFVLGQMLGADGRLARTWKEGSARLNAYLEDYALYAEGLLELYQMTFNPMWFEAARAMCDFILEHFADPAGGFFDTSDDHEELLFRPKEIQDGAMPSGGAAAASVLARLGALTGDSRYTRAAEQSLEAVIHLLPRAPLGFAAWLSALDFALAPPSELAIVGPDLMPMLAVVRAKYRPNLIVAAKSPGEGSAVGLLEGREAAEGMTTAYLCRQFACEAPITNAAELAARLDR
ncbi:MAG: thioredoxin domain-containing protein [Coriobacteriia bacterium]|nr:thioredoxin domain-containing protein [Coriobacteriia bacterium]